MGFEENFNTMKKELQEALEIIRKNKFQLTLSEYLDIIGARGFQKIDIVNRSVTETKTFKMNGRLNTIDLHFDRTVTSVEIILGGIGGARLGRIFNQADVHYDFNMMVNAEIGIEINYGGVATNGSLTFDFHNMSEFDIKKIRVE